MMNILVKILALLFVFALDVSARPVSKFNILEKLDTGPGNLTVTEDGRIIMSMHQFYAPKFTVVEVKKEKSTQPFPNIELTDHTSQATLKLDSVLGIRSDKNGIVWMLDNGLRSGSIPKVVGWNTKTNKLQQFISLPAPITSSDSFVNDFAVDTTRNHIFISDPAGGANAAIIVINLKTGVSRRVLEGHKSVIPENIDLIIDNKPVQIKDKTGKLFRPHIGVNAITEDLNNEWVYFGPMNGRSLYRVKADDLANEKLSPRTLAGRVQRYSDKPICDGITIDKENNIYLGELAANAIGVITTDRKYQRLVQSPELSWVDSLSFGPEGKLYAVVNRLHQSGMLNGGVSKSKPPYYLIEIEPLAAGLPGR
jgi:sugar lactone lactonase YvrE